ncbi:MAG: hypothetical protein MI919_34550 [Holophagales bacterium]|nr:hypothetical protein [Holophagales bacterium]
MSDPDDLRRERARIRRRRATLRKSRLGDGEVDLHRLRGAEALSLLTRLTQESWSLSGKPKPSYRRSEIPCRFVPGVRA